MAFLFKLNELRKELEKLERLVKEASSLCQGEGISDPGINKILNDLSTNTASPAKELKAWLEDKQSQLEELEFLLEGFRMEYGSVLDYRKFASMIQNQDLKKKLAAYGKEEANHAVELVKFINKHGGEPDYTFVVEKGKENWGPDKYLDFFIAQEKAAIDYYRKGEEKFQDAGFGWLIGKIKLEEKDHLKELEKLKAEFERKEVIITMDPDFHWVDPFMGEPGDRAWIE
ncbi:MAG: ferritin-like domain-containing protein [Nitrospinae bacterium]|nr:ferritin-like domain-containing protein [Nitrospinota bacterium]